MVRSFIDLRAFAARGAAAGDMTGGGTAVPLGDGPVSLSATTLTGGGRVAGLDADLFVLVLTGRLSVDDVALTDGGAMVVPAGCAFLWSAAPATVAIMLRCAGDSGAGGPVPIDHDAPLAPSGAPLAALLVGPTPSCRNATDYRSGNGEFVCGTWDSTPYHRLPMTYRHDELMHLLDGSVTFEDEAGRRATFGKGDVFMVEHGATCSWDSREHVKKVYAIWRPAA